MTGRVFDTLEHAQAELDAWVASYNQERPHSALDMGTPASRFDADRGRPADASALDVSRAGSDWITRKVAANGIISVAWQEINLGKARAGRHVNVHIDGPRLQVFDGDELLQTVLRTSEKEVRKKRYERRKTG